MRSRTRMMSRALVALVQRSRIHHRPMGTRACRTRVVSEFPSRSRGSPDSCRVCAHTAFIALPLAIPHTHAPCGARARERRLSGGRGRARGWGRSTGAATAGPAPGSRGATRILDRRAAAPVTAMPYLGVLHVCVYRNSEWGKVPSGAQRS